MVFKTWLANRFLVIITLHYTPLAIGGELWNISAANFWPCKPFFKRLPIFWTQSEACFRRKSGHETMTPKNREKKKIENCNFETIKNFAVLGSKITTDARYLENICTRTVTRFYFSLEKLFRSKCPTAGSKIRKYKSVLIHSSLLLTRRFSAISRVWE